MSFITKNGEIYWMITGNLLINAARQATKAVTGKVVGVVVVAGLVLIGVVVVEVVSGSKDDYSCWRFC